LPFDELPLTLLCHIPPVSIQHGPRHDEGRRLTALNLASPPKKNPSSLFLQALGITAKTEFKV